MNLPNILTILRIGMIPIVVIAFASARPYLALFFFLLASFTDFLDGYLARRLNQVTDFGKVMDPLADKLMLITTLICLCATGRIPLWVPIVIGIKEFIMITIAALLYHKEIIMPANFLGKLATVLFTLAVLLSFFSEAVAPWHIILLYISTAIAIIAMVCYGISIIKSNPSLLSKKAN